MAIALFEHNRIAYEAAVSLLAETGKAAVVHPTGTGKSFIAFKLCEDNPASRVCWLSPSAYIYETQLENLKSAADGWQPENVTFLTYAKLMGMTDEEIAALQPDYIILDEFHRCGAEMWGQGVQKLLAAYAATPVLGLSATAIRYLDNQRDMADELFGGSVASELTLGEAIVRGILAAPKYVLSVFSYQKDLERYKACVRRAKSRAVRDEAERYLEALRRALEKADGLDIIFDKHMTERTGKYIVFCANKEHMDAMMDKAPEWFRRVDKAPHIYSVYSDDPSASQSFADFKADEDGAHLKLLFCIDALNEGIHVENVSGVILLRPTVSPIIYKQQIGRALAAGKRGSAVIWDIVNNIENLYSIGAIEEEMLVATTYYRSLGEDQEIVNERFRVIDEVRECRELFEKLNDVLSAPWNVMYHYAKAYYEENGNLMPSSRYRTADGYSLGSWIFNQRAARKGQGKTFLTDEQVQKLDAIGMVWDNIRDLNWERNFNAAKQYYEEHGVLNPDTAFVTAEGIHLGSWLSNLRSWKHAGAHSNYLNQERIAQLEGIGMIWDVLDYYWERNYLAACNYYREHRNLRVPSNYITSDGTRLGAWISRLRTLRRGEGKGTPPTPEQIARLDAIGMIWETGADAKWNAMYQEARLFYQTHGNLVVPGEYRTGGGSSLRTWVARQRSSYAKGKLPQNRIDRLNAIGMVWDCGDPWMNSFRAARKYYKEHGTLALSQNEVVDGVWLGKWVAVQAKRLRDQEDIPEAQKKLLETLPLKVESEVDRIWNGNFDDLCSYADTYGGFSIPASYVGAHGARLSAWATVQRMKRARGELSKERIAKLESIGFPWKIDRWQQSYEQAKAYAKTHGNLDMQKAYKTEGGYSLGNWVYAQRDACRKGTLSAEKRAKLEKLGMVWKQESTWDINFSKAKAYYEAHGSYPQKRSAAPGAELEVATWVDSQRQRFNRGEQTPEHIEQLKTIGLHFSKPPVTSWEYGYLQAKAYCENHGNLDVPAAFSEGEGFRLGYWIKRQRENRSSLTDEQIQKLDAIGMVWASPTYWDVWYAKAKAYYEVHRTLPYYPESFADQDEETLHEWLRQQRGRRKAGKLEPEQIEALDAIGMNWRNSKEQAWENGFAAASEYYRENGNLCVPAAYSTQDGYPLGQWLHTQRRTRESIDPQRAERLNEIGMVWRKKTGDK